MSKSKKKTNGHPGTASWTPIDGEWLIARTDVMVKTEPVDVYTILDAPSLYIHGFEIVTGETMTAKSAEAFLKKGFQSRKAWPPRIAVPKGDPSGAAIGEAATFLGIPVEELPSSLLNTYAAPFLEDFAKEGYSFSPAIGETAHPNEGASARAMIPDSYDPCPCGSGVSLCS